MLIGIALGPATAGAFSFLPGGFAPGEKILTITLAPDTGGAPPTPTVTFNTVTNQLIFTAAVSAINTNVASYGIPIGDVIFNSQLDLNSELLLAPSAPFFGGLLTADFTNGLVADFTIIDNADGFNTLLAADYSAPLDFQADTPGGFGFPVTGRFDGDFVVLGSSDANFEAAFGNAGNYFANLSAFVSNGTPVTTDLCVLVAGLCITGVGTLDSFTVNPTATIKPVPEPAVVVLALLGLVTTAAALRRR
jgi:hypothetical protein